jgi:hypothetical protein
VKGGNNRVVGAEDTGEVEGGARAEILVQRIISVLGLVDMCDMVLLAAVRRGFDTKTECCVSFCWMHMDVPLNT